MSMRRRDPTDGDGEPDGGILAWATWFHLYGFATRRRNLFGQTGENGIWVPARRLAMVLLALVWLPAGGYASHTYLGVHYVPPVFLDGPERSGRQVAAQAETEFNGRMPNSSEEFEWRLVPAAITDVISLNARCADLIVVSQANPNESARRGSAELSAGLAPSASLSVLTVSYIGAGQTPGKYVTTAWNAVRHAPRSIGEAMPLLERLAVNPNENRDEHAAIPCADIVSQPARRSVHADAAIAMDNGINVSNVIPSQISDTESELFAMGAYTQVGTLSGRLSLNGPVFSR